MVSSIIDFCARNRLIVVIATLFAIAGSWYSIKNIPLDAIPDLSDTQVILYTEWMGRSPDLIEDQVTYPIVSGLLSAPQVTAVRGYSMFGMSFVYVIFDEGTDIYWARSRVLEYLKQIEGKLPAGVAPTLGPDASSVGWIFQYALVDTSGKNDISEIRTFQDFNLRYALSSVAGVAEVASIGGYEKQYQIEVRPERLQAYGLTIGDVAGAIRRSNADVGGRVIEMTEREYFVRGKGYIQDISSLKKISLGRSSNGTPILLGNVANVSFGPEIRRGVGEFNGIGEAVGGIVIMRHGENALHVIERVKAKLAEIKPSFPQGVDIEIVYDRSGLIERAIETLQSSLIEEGIVVALVIIIFLLHFGSSMVPIVALPIAVGLAFVPMYFLGINSNIMSLGGIAIAIGAMVDASIVLVENAHKKLEHAPPTANRTEVIIAAAKEVGPSIFYALLIITIAFLPIFALTGQGGRLFKPLAFTKTFAMFFGAVTAITIVPALMVWFIRGKIHSEDKHPVSRFIISLYKPFVFVALRNPKTTVMIGVMAIVSALPMIPKIGSEFMPPLNEGDILYMPTTFPNISIEAAKQYMQYQDRVIRSFPEVQSVYGKAGRAETATDPAPLSMLETVVRLKPREEWRNVHEERWYSSWSPEFLQKGLRLVWPDERKISWDELIAELDKAMQMPGWTNAWTMPIKTRIDMLSTGIRTPIGVKIFGDNLDEIERIGMELERTLSTLPHTRSVFSDRNTGGYYVDIEPNRDALARYGLTVGDVQDIIESSIGGQQVEVAVDGRKRYSINVRYPRQYRENIDQLKRILVPLPAASGASSSAVSIASGSASMSGMNNKSSGMQSPSTQGSAGGMGGASGMSSGQSQVQSSNSSAQSPRGSSFAGKGRPSVQLGQVADIRINSGPPMIRDENGMLVGYVYVDIDQSATDIGSYVSSAKDKVAGEINVPAGFYLKWTGQYELLEVMAQRMKIVIPLTLFIVIVLLYLNFRNFTETLIVLASVPFALVGSIWMMYFLDYNYSTATLVGIIALVGLATQTGIVMILYLDQAYEKRLKAGKIRDLNDIIWAHMEGTVMRVRPKLMTVGTMMIGLVPLLWATGAGADVMKRIAAPMVGGLISSAFLTLEIIPVVYTYWRLWQINQAKRTEQE
jgi:copper/silver efflux system protein